MQPTIDQVFELFRGLHGHRPTDEERHRLERTLRFGHALEPPWEQLAAPTALGPSWLGLLWWVLDAGPAAGRPAVVAALEWLCEGRGEGEGAPAEERRAALTEAVNALILDERRPLVDFEIGLRLIRLAEPCGQCGEEVSAGLVGWYQGADRGPLCRSCLAENAPSLTLLLDALIHGLPRVLRDRGLDMTVLPTQSASQASREGAGGGR